MKRKIILFGCGLLRSAVTCAQVLFSNNFSNLSLQSYTTAAGVSLYTTVPAQFSLINDGFPRNIGSTTNPNSPFHVPGFKNAGWMVGYNANIKDTFLVSSSWLDDTGQSADSWVLTPTVLVGANTVLTWLAMSPDPSFRDGYEVYGTDKTGTLSPSDFKLGDRLFFLPDANTGGGGEKSNWTRRSIPLGIFEGLTLRFAFRNNSKAMYQLWIDDIEIRTSFYNKEVELSSVVTEKYIYTDTLQSVAVDVTNLGAATIHSLTLNYQYGNSPVNTQSFVVAGGLSYLQSARLNFALKYSIASPGYFPVKSWISLVDGANDQNLGSDTNATFVTVQAVSPIKNVMVEQFVSAFNGDCPDAQDRALALQSERVVQINVHDQDSLKEFYSTDLLGAYRRSFASAMFDRAYDNELMTNAVGSTFYQSRLNGRLKKVTPASVSIIGKSYNEGTRELYFTVKADFVGEVKGDYRINAYLVENNVYGPATDSSVNGFNQLSTLFNVPWSPYHQMGYFSEENDAWVLDARKFKHQNVLVHSFNGSFGYPGLIPPNGGTAGQSYQQNFGLIVPSPTVGINRYNSDNLYLVGFVTEYNADKNKRNVLNVIREKVTANAEVVSLQEQNHLDAFGLYPNPSKGKFFLSHLKTAANYQITVYDLFGKSILQKEILQAAEVEMFDLSGVPEGLYIVELRSGNTVLREKLVVSNN
jgi:hypothetical protein